MSHIIPKDSEDTDKYIFIYADVYLCVHRVYKCYTRNNKPDISMHTSNLKSSQMW